MDCGLLAITMSSDSGIIFTTDALYSWNVVSSTPPID
jgi:hypothetical protein